MSGLSNRSATIRALPFQVVYLFYCLLFGVILKATGTPVLWSWSFVVILAAIGLFGLENFRVKDVPMAIGGMYVAGVLIGLLFLVFVAPMSAVTAIVFSALFVAGILGNVIYFLSENQKLHYLNGQRSEQDLSLRNVERWFPLWLVVIGNILLVCVITPLWWGSLYNVAGEYLFVFDPAKIDSALRPWLLSGGTEPNLLVWFVYLIENINESLLGIASLLGLAAPVEIVQPTGIGRILVLVFRLGILSLGLGAIKRYIDLRATTQNLMMALGRAGLERERWECTVEGNRTEHEKAGQEFENRRQMWQIRLRQLIQLYPAQLQRLVSEVTGRGDWQIRLKAKLTSRGHDPLQAKHLGDWISSELADVLADHALYIGDSATRQRVLRAMLLRLSDTEQLHTLSPRLRQRLAIAMARLLRNSDPIELQQHIIDCLEQLAQSSHLYLAQTKLDGWLHTIESRAHLAAIFGLLLMNQRQYLIDLLPAFQQKGSSLQWDAHQYTLELAERWISAEGSLLCNIERLLNCNDSEAAIPLLDEAAYMLAHTDVNYREVYQLFVAKALVLFWQQLTQPNTACLLRVAQVLLHCGEKNASQATWRIILTSKDPYIHQTLLHRLVEGGLAQILGSFLRHKLRQFNSAEQILAATLIVELPVDDANSEALRDMLIYVDLEEDVRWRVLCSMAVLARSSDLEFLQTLNWEHDQPRLWAAWMYAKACCGESPAILHLLDTLAKTSQLTALYLAIREVLADRRPLEVDAICIALDSEADSEARLEACETLVALESPLALAILGSLLGNNQTPRKVRQSVAEDLGLLGRSMHREKLGLMADSRSPAEWVAAPLLDALENDDDRLVRIRAARALGRLGLSEIRQRFQKILLDPSENAVVRQVVAEAVGEMGDHTWMPFLLEKFPSEKSSQVRQGMISALDTLGAEISFFKPLLSEKNARVQVLAIEALAARHLQADTQQNLIQMLDNSHKDVRTSAVEAVGKQNITEAFEQLLHLLDHNSEPEKNVRRAAIRSLRQLADTPTQKELARPHLERVFLQDPDHLVVQDAAAVIVALYKDSAADLLLNALQKRQENETWRKGYAGIVRALGDCNMPEANQYLFEQLEKQMRADVVNIARLIALLRPAGLAGGSRSLPILFELVQRDDPAFSWIAVQVMADIGDPQIIEPLQQYLTYKRSINQCEPNLEAVILVTLVRMGMWDYLPDLVALLRDTSHEREVARRRALGVLPDLQVDLSSMLLLMAISPQHTPHEKIRETSVRSLSRLSGQIDRLIHALQWQAQSDPRAKIRDEAKSAIESITRRISYLHRRLQRQIPFDTEAHLCWNQQPIHPVWLNQWEERKSSFIPMSLCYTPPTDILEANVSDILDDIETVETTELAAEAEQTSPQFTSESSTTDATITPSTTTQTTAPTAFIPSATTDTDKPLSLTSPPVTPIIAELPTPSAQPLTSIPTTDLTSTAPPLKAKKKAPAETPSTATKIEITAPEKPKPPSFLEQMLFAIATDDYHKISKLAQSPEAETLKPLWSDLWEFLAEKHNLVAKLGRDWIVVPGDPWGEANNWPFLMMTRPVNVCEYELFCEQTDHPLPERWELLANKKKLTIPIANITWWDANIYAETNGWMLPSHNQLILASACRNTTLLGEEVDNRSVFAWQEWTSTIHQHRHQLIQIFSLDEQLISHLRRDAKAFDLVFRCVIPLDCRKNSFGLALLQSHQRNASNFFRFVAQQRRVELPKATEEWLNYLEHLNPSQISDTSHALWSAVPEIPEDTSSNTPISKSPITQSISIKPTLPKLHTTSQEQISSDSLTPESPPITLGTLSSTTISTEPKVSPITAPVQLSQLEEAMDLVRDLELEPQMSLNELEQYPQQDQHVQKKLRQQAKDHYWKLIESGAWSQACEWLDVESELLPTSLTQQREGLIELCDWLQRQSGMVWLEGKTYGQAEDIGEYVMLVQSGYVSRGEFYRFCLERQIPLPPQWKDSPQIQDSDEPATEVSALAAHAYADYAQAQLPSLEQLQRLSPCMFLDRTIGEWTCTHYSHNARLYYSLSPADTSGQQSQRTMRRDEPARYVGFRLYQNISYTELPALLQMLVQHLPPAFPIDRFSQLLGPALRVHLNFAAQ